MPERFHALISDFCFGETSPRVKSRLAGGNIFGISPAEAYRSGCRDVTNMVIVPQGGAYRREGFKFNRDTTVDVPEGPASGEAYRMFALKGENADAIVLFVPGQVWVYQLPAFAVLGHHVTPYQATDLPNLGVTQFEKKVVVYSIAHRPRQITVQPFGFVDPDQEFRAPLYAFQDARSPLPQTSTWRMRITFTAGYTAQYMALIVSGRVISNARGRQVFAAASTSTAATQASLLQTLSLDNTYAYEVVVTYVGTGTVGTSTWYDYDISYKFQSKYGDGTGMLQALSLQNDQMQVVVTPTNDAASDLEPLWSGPLLLYHGAIWWQCIQTHISAAANEPGVGASSASYWLNRGATFPLGDDYDIDTHGWLIDTAYSPRDRGWPGHMAFHEQRLGGSGPQDALSVVAAAKLGGNNDMFNFTLGADDNDGLLFRLVSADNAAIHWFKSMEKLYIGTSAGVFVQTASPWTPTNVHFERINGFRCDQQVHAAEVEGELFFPTIGARQIRQVSFSNDLQAWQSFDLTAFAEHLFTDGLRIKQLASHEGVASILWAVRTDGALLGLTYSPAYNTLAWHKHSVADPVLQIAPAFDGQRYVTVALIWRRVYSASDGRWSSHPCFETLEHTSQNLFSVEPAMFDESQAPEQGAPPGFTPFTPELPDLLIPLGIFDINSYGASPAASSVTNLAALKAAANALSSAGGGTLTATTPGTYKIYAPGTLSVGMGATHTFVNMVGVMIDMPSVRLEVEDSFDPNEVLTLFQFLNVQNITIRVSTRQPKDNAMHLNQAGLALAAFGTRCARVLMENIDMDGGYAMCLVGRDPRYEDDSTYCHDFTIRGVTSDQLFYPYSFQNSGDNVAIQNSSAANCGRAYFMYGCKNQDIELQVDNPDHSPSVIVTTGGSVGRSSVAENVRLRISSAGQRALQANLCGIYPSILDITDPRPQRLSNFDVGFPSVDMVAAAPLYGIFTLPKVAWNYGIDTVPARGHIIENIVVGTGTINGAVNRGEIVSLCAEGNWAGETVRNVRIQNLTINGAPTSYIHVNLDPFVDSLVVQSVFTPSDIVLTGTGPEPIYRNTNMGGVIRNQGFFDQDERTGRLAWETVVALPAAWSVHLDSHEQIALIGLVQNVPLRFALRRVGIVANGVYLGSYQVSSSGQIVLTSLPTGSMWVGFEFPSRLEPNRFESRGVMTSQSMRVRWVKPTIRLLTSVMPLVNGFRPNERTQDDHYNEATGLFSGDVYVASFGSDGNLVIEPDLPLPCHVTGIFGLITAEEG